MTNYDRIQHASVRVKVDPRFVTLQTALDEAWYGDKDSGGRSDRSTGAKAGMRGRMWNDTEIASEDQFNRLSTLIEAHRMVALVDQNRADGTPYPNLEVKIRTDADGVEISRVNHRDEAVTRIDAERARGLDIDAVISRGQ